MWAKEARRASPHLKGLGNLKTKSAAYSSLK